jgi:hypothetical protein
MSKLTIDDLDLDFLWSVLLRHSAERRVREGEMPSKSKSQARLMRAAAHDAGFAKRAGVPVAVAKEFVRADQGRKAPAPSKPKGK